MAANQQLATATVASLDVIKQRLVAADVVHFDESGLCIAGKLNWLHVAGTPELNQGRNCCDTRTCHELAC